MRRVVRLLVATLVATLAARPAAAQHAGTAMQPAPAGIEVAPPAEAPMAVRTKDAERLEPPPPPAAPPPATTGPGGTTVEVGADAPPPQNATARFLLRDVTDRTAPRVKTLPERAATVESLRQSLHQGGTR